MLLIGLSLMLLTWLATTPSGTATDEADHYVKALAAGRGDLRGHAPGRDLTDPVIALLKARGRTPPSCEPSAGSRPVRAPSRCRSAWSLRASAASATSSSERTQRRRRTAR